MQQDKAPAIVVVPYWTTRNWFHVLLGMLVDHPLIMTASLNILYLPTHPTTPHPLHPKLKLLVAHISGEISSQKTFLQQRSIFSCFLGENQPGDLGKYRVKKFFCNNTIYSLVLLEKIKQGKI